jgi:phage tail sheath protein FI
VNRLVSVVSRASRRMGDDLVFQGNTPGLWAKLRSVLREVMLRLWRMQALDGAAPGDAFSIRCDRGTMTQNDIDNGRLIAEITFRAAAVIELIRVTLALEPGGASVSDTEAGVVGVA